MSKITVTTIAGLTSGGDANTVKIESGDALHVVIKLHWWNTWC